MIDQRQLGDSAPQRSARTAGIVLVHGAFHGSWCWEAVSGPLEELGWVVNAVELGLDTLAGDAEIVRDAVQQFRSDGRPVLVVGHSYGGVVVSAGGAHAQHLMLVAAGMPSPGECAGASADKAVPVSMSVVGEWAHVDPDSARDAFYTASTPERAASACKLLRPQRIFTQTEPVHDPAWIHVPTTYIVCAKDKVFPPEYQTELAARAQKSFELDSDHSPFFSASEQLIAIIDRCAREVVDGATTTNIT